MFRTAVARGLQAHRQRTWQCRPWRSARLATTSPKVLFGLTPPGMALLAQASGACASKAGFSSAAKADETEHVMQAWQKTASGLEYRDIQVGDGEAPEKGQTVYVHYTGRLESGKEFDSSIPRGQPLDFPVGTGKVIAGWDEGILTMRVGGKRQLRIPPHLGYGARGIGPIPPNATLIFDCELVGVGSKSLWNKVFG
mmetsp:Transcript_13361/g.31320  ORF Transcript_13361/g.31320 Transcript_13361/m.31320 type:complete len:197 (-) Transcript_13361:62-652(-)